MAGSGCSSTAEIESLLISNGLRDRTRIVGFVTGESKGLYLMQGSDILCLLTSHSENFAVSVLESLAVGVPVLVTPGVALASIVQENQLGYVPDMDVLAISNALEDYLNNTHIAKKMGVSAREFVLEKYHLV